MRLVSLLGFLLLALGVAAPAGAQSTPQYSGGVHIGVKFCAGSTCHGAPSPGAGSTVLQTEYLIWSGQDKHSKAYSVLLNERSRRIAANLGIGSAAGSPLCLNCHADNPSGDRRGKEFRVADGVGCEACHGGASNWLGVHIAGQANHRNNVAAGMYPTEDAGTRARLCLSCHFGDENKFVTHRIMGAGHPRMDFELEQFTEIQPAHFRVDADYVRRKPAPGPVQTWLAGQVGMLTKLLDATIDPRRNHDGAFPELVLFDCTSCHHSMKNLRWEARASTGLPPGVVRYNDANLVVLRVVAARNAPDLAAELTERGRELHAAVMQGNEQMAAAARRLRESVSRAGSALNGMAPSAVVAAMLEGARSGEFVYFNAAEQATLAMTSLVAAMRGDLGDGRYRQARSALQDMRNSISNDATWTPAAFQVGLRGLQDAVGK